MWQVKSNKEEEIMNAENADSNNPSRNKTNKKNINGGIKQAEEVEEEELHITQTDLFKQQSIRNAWKPGSQVEIYSESQAKWNQGKITKIFNDDEGEWLVIKYAGSTKEIQRFNECVRPPQSGKHKYSNKKPTAQHFTSPPTKTLKPSAQQKLTDLKEIKQIITTSIKATTSNDNQTTPNDNNVSKSLKKRESMVDITRTTATGTENGTKTNGDNNTNGHEQEEKIVESQEVIKCPHGDMSQEELGHIKIKNRKVCTVRGLPSFATEKLLIMNEWYGQFKGMTKINISRGNKHKSLKNTTTDSITAFLTFDNEKSASDAINFSNQATFGDGRKLKAAHGIQYYCRDFLAGNKCELPYCRYKHEWVKDERDIITAHDVDDFKAKDCGLSLYGNVGITENINALNTPTGRNTMSPMTPITPLMNVVNTPVGNVMVNNNTMAGYQQQQQQQRAQYMQQQHAKQQQIKAQRQQQVDKPVNTDKLQKLVNEKIKLKKINDDLSKTNDDLKNKLAASKMKCKALEADNTKLKSVKIENKRLKEEQDKLIKQQKEMKAKYAELEKKYNLAVASNKNWDEWDGKDIVNWLVGLDEKRYGKYRKDLAKNIANEGVNGECLPDLERNDLHRLGITQFKDKKDVANAIQELVKGNNDKQ